ncbi:flagellar export chaperone FliS [Noviherbaspirillum pedocola]|uniref:Flagellar secretion chaperone FliS n=1 Tax=Noviherbaspirillum pedocola TaxID=2801341 RepID=A0A934W684_9BURK|nr:flagellar export chaperone FliS [Noviherbaspirillum pedocola]MBK4735897.1 flagellar export chaperone FliS [Noviherbaspirillum pedocola]
MFGSAPRGAGAYARVGVETGVYAASPHQLIVMLYDGAIAMINDGMREMAAGNVAAKGRALSRAIAIVSDGLRVSLDKSVGGELAHTLDALYAYIVEQLVYANRQNDSAKLSEASRILSELRSAWRAIDTQAAPPVPTEAAVASTA